MTSATVLELRPRSAPAAEPERVNQHLLSVTFESADGVRRSAFGGGETVAEAVAAARGELPSGTDWSIARWSPVFGE